MSKQVVKVKHMIHTHSPEYWKRIAKCENASNGLQFNYKYLFRCLVSEYIEWRRICRELKVRIKLLEKQIENMDETA